MVSNVTYRSQINTPDTSFVFGDTKPPIITLSMNNGVNGSTTIPKIGPYYLTTLNAATIGTSAFDFRMGSTATSFPTLRIQILPEQVCDFYFQTVAPNAVLHGYQASGVNSVAYITYIGE